MPRPPELPVRRVEVGDLLQHVSRQAYRATALHFGRSGSHRFDDPERGHGVLYFGFDLATALMESVFHHHQWHRHRRRVITLSEVEERMVRVVGVIDPLRLVDLTAPGVMASRLGLNLSQLSSRRYVHTQRVSSDVYALVDASGIPVVDGLLYPSRNNHPACCAAVFERAAAKLTLIDDIALRDHVDWPGFLTDYNVVVLPV